MAAKVNSNYQKLQAGYLFPEISRRVNEYLKTNKTKKLIRMGIGDVVRPLSPTTINAFLEGVEEMGKVKTFKGYGPEQGYDFLRELIAENAYEGLGISSSEIFVSDGSKCDTANIQELFAVDNTIAIPDPVYPVYVDTNVMAGRTGAIDEKGYYGGIVYLPCTEENHFVPQLPKQSVDIIYLCFPNNPTGTVATREELKKWVDYAKKEQAVILYDAAYESFITNPNIPHSIYEIEDAKRVAIEFRSFSKNAGFTGTRCAFTVVPHELEVVNEKGKMVSLHSLWNRRQSTKFNGVNYPVQKAAAATFSPQGKREIAEIVAFYMQNAQTMKKGLESLGHTVFGGENAPYLWMKNPKGVSSWDMFDIFLQQAAVVGTPGSGFGPSGEGYFRFSAFTEPHTVELFLERLKEIQIRN